MANKGIRGTLMAYFAKRPGEHVFLNDIAKETGLDPRQVQANINNINGDHRKEKIDFPLEVITNGQVWIYRPGKPTEASSKRMFEELGVTKAGELIIQDAEGTLFKAAEL